MFSEYRRNHTEMKYLKRSSQYSFLDLREKIIEDIVKLKDYENPPIHAHPKTTGHFTTAHFPVFKDKKRKFTVCYCEER